MHCKKTSYPDEKSALSQVPYLKRKYGKYFKEQRAYICELCGNIHLTSEPDFKIMISEIERLKNEINNLKEFISKNKTKELKQENEQLKNTIKNLNFNLKRLSK